MNLAEIRKKAAKGETRDGAGREANVAPEQGGQAPPVEPEPSLPDAVAPEFFAPEFADPQPAAPEFPAQQLAEAEPQPEPSRPFWQAESAGQFPDSLECEEESDEFDPAAVILRGRESASFEVEVSQQEVMAATSVELLCFRVASEEYAISIMDIKEIIKPREVTEVPRVPPFVRGILSLRGNIIPIFDMKVRLGLCDGAATERERIVVVKRQGGFAGVLVDEVVQVVRIAQAGIEPPPVVLEGIDREFVLGIGRVGGRMLILLDMEKVLDVGLL